MGLERKYINWHVQIPNLKGVPMKQVTGFILSLTAMLAMSVGLVAAHKKHGGLRPPRHKIDKRVLPIKGGSEHPGTVAQSQAAQLPVTYHGGPVMTRGVNVYYIWYGNWTSNSAVQILTDLINSLRGSPWLNIQTTYYQISGGVKVPIQNFVALQKSTFDNYSRGKNLNDSAIAAIVQRAITTGALPLDPMGAYFVLTSTDVAETSGFCTQYCGWHSYMQIGGKKIPYSFVGNAAKCLSACAEQKTSPNGNAGADAMASVIAHELTEIMTDPVFNGWYDANGNETADKCAWTFGSTYKAPNSSNANVKLGNRNFLIQQNWINSSSGGSCSMHYP